MEMTENAKLGFQAFVELPMRKMGALQAYQSHEIEALIEEAKKYYMKGYECTNMSEATDAITKIFEEGVNDVEFAKENFIIGHSIRDGELNSTPEEMKVELEEAYEKIKNK